MNDKDLFIRDLFDKHDFNFHCEFNMLTDLGLVNSLKDKELWVMTAVRSEINYFIMNYSNLSETRNIPLTRAELIAIYNHMATLILKLKGEK